MKTYRVKIERTYTTYVDVVSESKESAMDKLSEMTDEIALLELEQMDVTEEITIEPLNQ